MISSSLPPQTRGYIAGKWVAGATAERIRVIKPLHTEVLSPCQPPGEPPICL